MEQPRRYQLVAFGQFKKGRLYALDRDVNIPGDGLFDWTTREQIFEFFKKSPFLLGQFLVAGKAVFRRKCGFVYYFPINQGFKLIVFLPNCIQVDNIFENFTEKIN